MCVAIIMADPVVVVGVTAIIRETAELLHYSQLLTALICSELRIGMKLAYFILYFEIFQTNDHVFRLDRMMII